MYLDKSVLQKVIYTPGFIAVLLTIAKIWKQPKEQIKKMWYIYETKYYTAIKKDEITPFAAI